MNTLCCKIDIVVDFAMGKNTEDELKKRVALNYLALFQLER